MQKVTVMWCGEELEFTPSHDLYMRIEDKVSFNRLAMAFSKAAEGEEGQLDLPMSQVSWVLFCILRHCGVKLRTPMDVHQALFAGDKLPNYGAVLGALITAYYGAMPERPPKPAKKAPARKTRSRR
jgi:hypothetical protein